MTLIRDDWGGGQFQVSEARDEGLGRMGTLSSKILLDWPRQMVDEFPNATLVEVADSGTLIPEDQPERFAEELRAFVGVA